MSALQIKDKDMVAQGTVAERPVQRDPKSGHYMLHPAYEGWYPADRLLPSFPWERWVNVGFQALALVFGAAALWAFASRWF
jgi:hypothetical protein